MIGTSKNTPDPLSYDTPTQIHFAQSLAERMAMRDEDRVYLSELLSVKQMWQAGMGASDAIELCIRLKRK